MTAQAATEFDRVTAVTSLCDGAWAAAIDSGWFAGRGPNGGYLAAIGGPLTGCLVAGSAGRATSAAGRATTDM